MAVINACLNNWIFFVNIPVTPTEYVGASYGGKLGVLLQRGTENETEWKTEWNGSFEWKPNIWISLIQLLTKENDLK